MAMEITNNYSNYVTSTMEQKAEVKQENAVASNTTNAKSAGMNYLQGLRNKYSGTAFTVGTVSKGQTYGNSSDINFVINSNFVSKLGIDSEKQKQFEEDIEYLTNFSKRFKEQQAANGWNVENSGWFCDKDGNWGGWCLLRKTDEKSFLQKMQDKSDEIREEKNAKKLEQRKLEEKQKSKTSDKESAVAKAEEIINDKLSTSEDGKVYLDDTDMKIIMNAAKDNDTQKLSEREQAQVGANVDYRV